MKDNGEQRYRQTHVTFSKKYSPTSVPHSQVTLWHHVSEIISQMYFQVLLAYKGLAFHWGGGYSWIPVLQRSENY